MLFFAGFSTHGNDRYRVLASLVETREDAQVFLQPSDGFDPFQIRRHDRGWFVAIFFSRYSRNF